MTDLDWASLQQQAKDVLIPDGEYAAIVIQSSAANSSNGKPMIKLQLAVVEGPYRDRKLFTQLTLSAENPFALQKWFEHLASFGLDHNYFNNNKPSLETLARELLNRGVVATVDHHEYNGSERNNITGYRPYAPNGPTPPGMILGPARIPTGGANVPSATPSTTESPNPANSPSTPARPF